MTICGIVGCSNRKGLQKDVSFFKVPKILTDQGEETMKLSEERRRLWKAAINRKDIETEEKWERTLVCSKHFVGGVKAYLHDRTSPSWLPTLDLGYTKMTSPAIGAAHERFIRASQRKHKRNISDAVSSLLTLKKRCIELGDNNASGISDYAENTDKQNDTTCNDHKLMEHVSFQPAYQDEEISKAMGIQTDLSVEAIKQLQDDNKSRFIEAKRESRENEDALKSSQASSGYPTTLMLNTREDDHTRSYEASTPSPASSSLETTCISTTEVVHDKGEPQNCVLREAHVTESANRGKAKFTPALPETATVEVVVRCDGIVERTELKKEIQPIADMLARGDYSFLSEEYKHLLRRGVTASHSKSGTLSNNPAFDSVNKDKKKIHYLVEAKDEIYKLLSRVVLSKHKFKKLLSWMKCLHLVSGKNGKYFLSERNLLGATCVTNGGDKDSVKSSSVPETESWRIAPSALPNPLLQPIVTTGIQKKDTRLFLEPQMFQNPNKLATSMQTSAENKPLFVLMPNKPVSTSQATAVLRPSLNTSISGVSSACTVPSVVTTTSNVNLSNLVLSSVSLDVEKSTSNSFILKRKKRKSKYDIDHLVSNIENAPSPVPIKLFRVYDTNSDNNSTEHIMLETNSETNAIQEHTGNDNRVGLSRMRTRKSKLNDHDSSIQEQDSEEFEESERLIQESQYGDDYENYVVKTEPPDDYE